MCSTFIVIHWSGVSSTSTSTSTSTIDKLKRRQWQALMESRSYSPVLTREYYVAHVTPPCYFLGSPRTRYTQIGAARLKLDNGMAPLIQTPMDETSLSLLDRIRETDDTKSWDRLVALYAPLLKRWVRQYDVQESDADDLVQEVLTVVSQELPKFNHNQRTGAFRSWLRKILVHRLQNYWRGRKQRPAAKGGSSLLEPAPSTRRREKPA